jgi:hypothetical protein
MYLAVDLASRFSAAVLRDLDGKVVWQGDSGDMSPKAWCRRLATVVETAKPTHILVEDLPYGISQQGQTKAPTRLQGMLMMAVDEDFYFINPSTWQKDYPGVARAPKELKLTKAESLKYRDAKALEHANNLGYSPPDLVAAWQEANPELKPLKKYTNPLVKQMTDYVAAYLISDWLIRHKDEYTTTVGVQIAMI